MSTTNTPSLADRMGSKPLDAGSATFTPGATGQTSWADEVASPTVNAQENPLESKLAQAQGDGATAGDAGSGLHDTQYGKISRSRETFGTNLFL